MGLFENSKELQSRTTHSGKSISKYREQRRGMFFYREKWESGKAICYLKKKNPLALTENWKYRGFSLAEL